MVKRRQKKGATRSAKRQPRNRTRHSVAKRSRNYKAEYARRVAKAEREKRSRQSARGHKPKEHVARKEREQALFGISSDQMRTIRSWCIKYRSRDVDCADMIDEARRHGYAWFKRYREIWDAARRKYRHELKAGTWESRGKGYLEDLTGRAKAPGVAWMYYH